MFLDRPPNTDSLFDPSVFARGRVCDDDSWEEPGVGVGASSRAGIASYETKSREGGRELWDWVPLRWKRTIYTV